MKEPQGGLEIVEGRVTRNDDGHAFSGLILQRCQDERASLDSEAGDVERLAEEPLKFRSLRQLGAKLGDEGIVSGQAP